MPQALNCTLVADGPSDRALVPILKWLLCQQLGAAPIRIGFPDLRTPPNLPQKLPQRIAEGIRQYPCELLFVHRDAEREPPTKRRREIQNALAQLPAGNPPPWVGVVPIRMQETWLLINETALREAADNPKGRQSLQMPPAQTLEGVADSKKLLHELLCKASGLRGRKLRKFKRASSLNRRSHRLAELIGDFSRLRRLSAFRKLEHDVQDTLKALNIGA